MILHTAYSRMVRVFGVALLSALWGGSPVHACPAGTGGGPNVGTSLGLQLAQLDQQYQPLIAAALATAYDGCKDEGRRCDATDFFEVDDVRTQYLVAIVQLLQGQNATLDADGPSVGIPRLGGTWSYTSKTVSTSNPTVVLSGTNVIGGEWPRYIQCSSPLQFVYDTKISNIRMPSDDVAYFQNLSFAPLEVTGLANYSTEQLSHVEHAGGGVTRFIYDDRGNMLEKILEATDQSAQIVERAYYPPVCANLSVCNQPVWVEDGESNRTDYEYYDHGAIKSVTSPDVDGVQAQVRFEYQQFEARYMDASAQVVASGELIWLITREAYCRTSNYISSACVNGATDETVTTYDYGPDSGPNNLWLRGIVVTAEGQSLRTCYSYDVMGNQLTETAPNANLTSCP